MSTASKKMAYIQIVFSGIFFGFLGIWGKWAFAVGMRAGELTAFRFVSAALMMAIYMVFKNPQLFKISRKHLIYTCILGIFGYTLLALFYFIALEGISPSLAVLILYTYPVFVSLGGYFFFKDPMTKLGWSAIPLAVLGLVCLLWGDLKIEKLQSVLLVVACVFIYATYILVSRKWLKEVSEITSTFYVQFSSAIVLSIAYLNNPMHVADLFAKGWYIVLGIGFFSTVLAMLFFFFAVKYLTSAEMGILSTGEPLTAVVASALIFGDPITALQIIGGVLVLLAMIFVTKSQARSSIVKEKIGAL